MGIFKRVMFYGFGLPVRPTSKKDRLYRQQMGYGDPGQAISNMFSNIRNTGGQPASHVVEQQQEISEEGRVPCPTCAERILPAALKCRYCSAETGFEQRNATKQVMKSQPTHDAKSPNRRLAEGRKRKPGSQWQCTRCQKTFELRGPVESVPTEWWSSWNPELGETTPPWTCPRCGSYALTVPTGSSLNATPSGGQTAYLASDERRCPHCDRTIKSRATKCRHCRQWLRPDRRQ